MVLKQIKTRYLQNHCEVVIDLPPTGLIVFNGPNSNGKSVIVRATRSIINGDIKKPRKRAALVNKQATFGEIIYTRDDDVVLTVHITREAATTYVKYEEPGKDPIVRYLADKNYLDLVYQFGWHYDVDTGICLNIAEAEEALLFYKTSNKANGSIIQSATSDTSANKVAESFEATIKETRSLREQYIQQVRAMSSALQGLQIENINELIEMKEKLERYYRNLIKIYFPNLPTVKSVPDVKAANFYRPTIPEVKAVPNVRFTNVSYPKIPKIKYPRIVDVKCSLPDITGVASELKTLKEHKCPLCGRGFDCAC